MNCYIGNQNYELITDPIKDEKDRLEYFALTKKVFGLDFSIWYDSGFWGEQFIPYTLFDQEKAAASVGVSVSDMKWNGQMRKFAQVSTVMTHPDDRKKGLNQWLLNMVIGEWKDKCDCLYLYANDSVVDYYPKFGFKKSAEYRYKKEIRRKKGNYRTLDLKLRDDVDLLFDRYSSSNVYSLLTMEHNFNLLMFHCQTFLSDNIYYIEEYNAVVIAEYEDGIILCYDIYTDSQCCMEDILGVLVKGDMQTVVLGFTLKSAEGYLLEEVQEKDYHVFILKDRDGLFEKNKVSLPLLSHA